MQNVTTVVYEYPYGILVQTMDRDRPAPGALHAREHLWMSPSCAIETGVFKHWKDDLAERSTHGSSIQYKVPGIHYVYRRVFYTLAGQNRQLVPMAAKCPSVHPSWCRLSKLKKSAVRYRTSGGRHLRS